MFLFHVCYRRSLENFFNYIAKIYKSKSVSYVVEVIDRYKVSNKDLISNLERSNIRMSQVNELLLIPDVQSAIWKHFNIEESCKLPDFSEELLYGAVSMIIHHPSIKDSVISDLSVERCFYEALAKHQKRNLVLFSEYDAVYYEELKDQ